MSLVEKYALLPDEIDRLSIEVVEASLPDLQDLTPEERYVVFRVVRAEGDPEISKNVGFSPGAVSKGIAAVKAKAAVVTDVRMVEVGISKALLRKCGLTTHCQIDTPNTAERAKEDGTTRSVAAIRELAPYLNGAIAVVGNAPTALLALLDMIKDGEVSPALVIGMPVGFIACAESKAELAKVDVPYISIWEKRGGSSAAAATMNALLGLALQEVTL
ncbi:MAG: precorrin-8X methylmutase [Dehalococcoidia bacterium]|nr:precorrin-8X methylmutase [Dehalococcoidia bacterium]